MGRARERWREGPIGKGLVDFKGSEVHGDKIVGREMEGLMGEEVVCLCMLNIGDQFK